MIIASTKNNKEKSLYEPYFPDEWGGKILFDLAEWKNGLAFRDISFSDYGMPVIKIAELKNGITSQTKFTNQVFDDSVFLTKNDMIFSWSGNPETSIDAFWYNLPDGWLNQHIFKVNTKEEVDEMFFFYILKYLKPNFTMIASNKQTTGLGHVTISDLKQIKVGIPPLPTQRAIAATLSCLDDKIELNNRINANLEAQAQAIFKSWFLDFEPWGGVMPDDWKIVKLDDLCDTVTKGTTPTTLKRQFTKQGINFIKAESILANHSLDFSKLAFIDKETNSLLQRSTIQENDIIFTIAGTLGRFAFVGVDLLPANTNQAVAIIRADTGKIKPIALYSFFIGGLHSDFYTKNIQQAVQANLSLTTIKALPLAIPSREVLAEYTSLIEPIFEQIFRNHREAHTLAAIRDALLPRLMSGEIEVEDD